MAEYKGSANEASRAMHILKKREIAKEELEIKKRKLDQNIVLDMDQKFATNSSSIEAQLRSTTVGLVTLEQMKERHEQALRDQKNQHTQDMNEQISSKEPEENQLSKSKNRVKLSFGYSDDEESDEDDNTSPNKSITMNAEVNKKKSFKESIPNSLSDIDVDTSYLPDRRREQEERRLREQLEQEWHDKQKKLKEEVIEITFSYWDGSGHRRVAVMKKGHTIYQFLQKCLEILRNDFSQLRSVSADHLMYIKEDLIIPHHYTFCDFIVTKARGKSGPLFSFDVHEDVRLMGDASVEKDESHAGKVLLRSWYERNKHIFPASRWEPYDPTKSYSKYTIGDRKKENI